MTITMQQEEIGNLDPQQPFIMRVCLSPEMPVIIHAGLRFRQEPFEVNTAEGLLRGSSPTELRLAINGVDVTDEYGPFLARITYLRVAERLQPTGWNEITFHSSTPGRIEAQVAITVAGRDEPGFGPPRS